MIIYKYIKETNRRKRSREEVEMQYQLFKYINISIKKRIQKRIHKVERYNNKPFGGFMGLFIISQRILYKMEQDWASRLRLAYIHTIFLYLLYIVLYTYIQV